MLSEQEIRASEEAAIKAEKRRKQAEAEARRQELLRKQQEMQAAEAAKQEQERQQQQEQAEQQKYQDVNEAAVQAQPQQREEGFVTQLGEGIGYTLSPDGLTADVLNAAAAGINQLSGGNLQGLDDFVLGSEEQKKLQQEKFGNNAVVQNMEALSSGIESGIATPFTVAARLTNQRATWSEAPAIVKQNPIADTVFTITEILVPTLLTGGVAGPALGTGQAGLGALSLESALETAHQDSADDILAGRTLAQGLGYVANYIGLDGAQLTTDLIEGTKPHAQTLNAVVGFFQNLGINIAADQVLKRVGGLITRESLEKGSKETTEQIISEAAEDTARVLREPVEDVQKALDDKLEPTYTADAEPHEVMDIDTQVSVTKPSGGNEYVSSEAIVAEALRQGNLGDDFLTASDRKYFTKWSTIAEEEGTQKALQEATATLRKLTDANTDLNRAMLRAQDWWVSNKALLGQVDEFSIEDIEKLAKSFADDMTVPGGRSITSDYENRILSKTEAEAARKDILGRFNEAKKDLPESLNVTRRDAKGRFIKGGNISALATTLREFTSVSEEGFMAAALVGEELGIRLQRSARQIVNLENLATPIDFTTAVQNFIELQDRASLFLVPLRRGKRKWYIEGQSQQRRNIRSVRDADIQSQIKKAEPVSFDAKGRDFETVTRDASDPGVTIRELWNEAQRGDGDALNTLKAYFQAMAYADPHKVVEQTVDLTSILQRQLKQGRKDAVNQLFYGFMLSRVGTQVASASSNIARLVAEPLGNLLSLDKGQRAYGMGQLIGGATAFQDALAVGIKSFDENRAIHGSRKIDLNIGSLKKRQLEIERTHEAVMLDLNQRGASWAEKFNASMNFHFQSWMNHPVVGIGNRFLTAQDDMAKTLFASQVATGRAWKFAADTDTWDILNHHVKTQMRNTFEGGVKNGKILDGDVIAGANSLTFQSDIPTNGNLIDQAFLSLKDSADNSAFWRFFVPFTRVSYNILETAGRYDPSGLTQHNVKRFRQILDGQMGDVAQLQLKGQIAFSRLWTASVVTAATMGYVTGNNSGTMPRRSFIFPANNKDGFIAVSYEKLEPFATITSVISDAIVGLKDDVITEGQYQRFIEEMLFSLAMSTFDKSFMSGMQNMSQLFNVRNFGDGTAMGLARSAGFVVPGTIRMIADWAQPFETINRSDNFGETLWATFKQRVAGGIGNPVRYNELTGKPIAKVGTVDTTNGDDYWTAVFSGVMGEFVTPGKVRGGEQTIVTRMLDKVGFKRNSDASLKSFEGIDLSLEQQSKLSYDMHHVAGLHNYLEQYFNGKEFKLKLAEYYRFRKSDKNSGLPYEVKEDSRAQQILERIHADIRSIFRERKEVAVKQGQLASDPEFQQIYGAAKFNTPVYEDNNSGGYNLFNMFR